MSSLLPLIVLSIAFLHCAQADDPLKCQKYDQKFFKTVDEGHSIARRDAPPTHAKVECPSNICSTTVKRIDGRTKKVEVTVDCAPVGTSQPLSDEAMDCSSDQSVLKCFCKADTYGGGICTSLHYLFDERGGEDQANAVAKLRAIGVVLIPEVLTLASHVPAELGLLADFRPSSDTRPDANAPGKKLCKKTTGIGAHKGEVDCSTVCFAKLQRIEEEERIDVEYGCDASPTLIDKDYDCKWDSSDYKVYCKCNAIDKMKCNEPFRIFDTEGNEDQKTRAGQLREIGVNLTIKTQMKPERRINFRYDKDFGKPTTTSTRAPVKLPEDDPHYRELEGSATGLSLIFAVLFSILRLI